MPIWAGPSHANARYALLPIHCTARLIQLRNAAGLTQQSLAQAVECA
jgi:DNA-binding XRE family transcriptional regulator